MQQDCPTFGFLIMNATSISSRRLWGLSLAAVAILASMAVRPQHLHSEAQPYHSRAFMSAYGGLPDTSNALFTGSGKCAGCHGTDPNAFASLVGQTYPAVPMPNGHDVNPTDQWRSSLMGNSAKDPFWRAKVAHEVAINPDHQLELEDKCTSCHAPLGHFNAHHLGADHYAMAQLFQDSLALDGVSCVACHQQAPSVGTSFSGELAFDSAMIYGPYGAGKDDPPLYDPPMITYTGYNIGYGAHVDGSEVCAGCHSLVTHTADMEGNLTGEDYVEQATYHEWLNSAYADDGESPTECQDCHMPKVDGGVIISSGYAFLEPRQPFSQHLLVGGNVQMLEILRDNIELLGLTASEAQFDSTIAWTKHLLRNETVDLSIDNAEWIGAHGSLQVTVRNKAGHKFPSGYPARRAWIEVVAHQGADTLWHSGKWGEAGFLYGVDEAGLSSYEPHYNEITSEDEVQVYELVAVDVTGAPTNVLERAAGSAKDNRLLPLGFSDSHPVYDTTRVEGAALEDVDYVFNSEAGLDRVTYAMMAEPEAGGSVTLDVRVWYQSMPARWIAPMFEVQDSTIQAFQMLFEAQGAAPELVAEATVSVPVLASVGDFPLEQSLRVHPNPTSDGQVAVRAPRQALGGLWELYAPTGSRIAFGRVESQSWELVLPQTRGTYVLRIHGSSQTWSRRIVRR